MTARPRGSRSRAAARGAAANIRAAEMGVRIIENSWQRKDKVKELEALYAQLQRAYKATGSWTARKKLPVVAKYIELAKMEAALPSI